MAMVTIATLQLSLVMWRDHLFVHIHRAVIDAVLALVDRERNGQMIETKLISIVKESFGEFSGQ